MTATEYEILDAWLTGTCAECGGTVRLSISWENDTYCSTPIGAKPSCGSCQARLAKASRRR